MCSLRWDECEFKLSDNKCLWRYLSVCGVIHRYQCVMEYGARRRKMLGWLGWCGSQHRLQRHSVVEITARASFVSSCVTCCHPIRRVAACCWASELKSGSHLKVTFRVNSTATSETTVTHNLHICLSRCLCCVCLRGFAAQWWRCPQTVLYQKSKLAYTSETSSWVSNTVSTTHPHKVTKRFKAVILAPCEIGDLSSSASRPVAAAPLHLWASVTIQLLLNDTALPVPRPRVLQVINFSRRWS